MELCPLHKKYWRRINWLSGCSHGQCWVNRSPLHIHVRNQKLYFRCQKSCSRVPAGFQWHTILTGQLGYFYLFLIRQNETTVYRQMVGWLLYPSFRQVIYHFITHNSTVILDPSKFMSCWRSFTRLVDKWIRTTRLLEGGASGFATDCSDTAGSLYMIARLWQHRTVCELPRPWELWWRGTVTTGKATAARQAKESSKTRKQCTKRVQYVATLYAKHGVNTETTYTTGHNSNYINNIKKLN